MPVTGPPGSPADGRQRRDRRDELNNTHPNRSSQFFEAQCPMTSKIPRRTSLTCEEESVLSIFGRQRVRFARFVGRRVATRDNEVCLSGRLGDRFGRFPGCMNVSASRPSAAGRGKLSGRRRRSSTTNWQKGKFDVIGHQRARGIWRRAGTRFVLCQMILPDPTRCAGRGQSSVAEAPGSGSCVRCEALGEGGVLSLKIARITAYRGFMRIRYRCPRPPRKRSRATLRHG